MSSMERRAFLGKGAGMLVAGALGGVAVNAVAGPHSNHAAMSMGNENVFGMSASTGGKCGTCAFWGGKRRLSRDGKVVEIDGLGWCNNPDSHNYQKVTSPDSGPMPGWKKWERI